MKKLIILLIMILPIFMIAQDVMISEVITKTVDEGADWAQYTYVQTYSSGQVITIQKPVLTIAEKRALQRAEIIKLRADKVYVNNNIDIYVDALVVQRAKRDVLNAKIALILANWVDNTIPPK